MARIERRGHGRAASQLEGMHSIWEQGGGKASGELAEQEKEDGTHLPAPFTQ